MRKEIVSGVGLGSLEGQSYAKLGAIAAVGARLFAVPLVAAKVLVVNNLNSTTEAVGAARAAAVARAAALERNLAELGEVPQLGRRSEH